MTKHFNGLTAAEAERIALLLEEAGEVVQACGKILRHGYDSRHPDGGPDNRESLEKELGDLMGAADLMVRASDLSDIEVTDHRRQKLVNCRQYMHHQPRALMAPHDATT